MEARQEAFDMFWQLGDRAKQWTCINSWIVAQFKEADKSKKKVSHWFTLPQAGKAVKVCKKMFLQTLGKCLFIYFFSY